jgi:hypothetical protein
VRYGPRPFSVTVDGDIHHVDAWMVAVGVTPNYVRGGPSGPPDRYACMPPSMRRTMPLT